MARRATRTVRPGGAAVTCVLACGLALASACGPAVLRAGTGEVPAGSGPAPVLRIVPPEIAHLTPAPSYYGVDVEALALVAHGRRALVLKGDGEVQVGGTRQRLHHHALAVLSEEGALVRWHPLPCGLHSAVWANQAPDGRFFVACAQALDATEPGTQGTPSTQGAQGAQVTQGTQGTPDAPREPGGAHGMLQWTILERDGEATRVGVLLVPDVAAVHSAALVGENLFTLSTDALHNGARAAVLRRLADNVIVAERLFEREVRSVRDVSVEPVGDDLLLAVLEERMYGTRVLPVARLSAQTLELRWEIEHLNALDPGWRAQVRVDPAGERFFVATDAGRDESCAVAAVYAFATRDGRPLWTREFGVPPEAEPDARRAAVIALAPSRAGGALVGVTMHGRRDPYERNAHGWVALDGRVHRTAGYDDGALVWVWMDARGAIVRSEEWPGDEYYAGYPRSFHAVQLREGPWVVAGVVRGTMRVHGRPIESVMEDTRCREHYLGPCEASGRGVTTATSEPPGRWCCTAAMEPRTTGFVATFAGAD